MVKVKRFWIGIILFCLLALSGCSAFQATNLGFMDMERVFNESERAKELQQELTEIGSELEEQYNQRENQEEGEEELERIYSEYLENKQRLEAEFNQEINSVLAEISKEKKLEIILHQDGVYYGGIDITDEVIKALDERYAEGGEKADGEE